MSSIFRKIIADMREERNMTVEQLSALCGIPAPVLDGMEKGRAKLPFTALIRIIRAFSPSVGAMVLGKNTKLSVLSVSDQEKIAVMEQGIKYIPLSSGYVGGHMTPYTIEIPGGQSWPDPESDMTGEYFVYVLQGSIEAKLGGETFCLTTGDSIYYDTSIDHSLKNTDDTSSKLLIVLD